MLRFKHQHKLFYLCDKWYRIMTVLVIFTAAGFYLGLFPVVSPKSTRQASDTYSIGVGIADCTGPAVEINLMGYAMLDQVAKGIHLRLFSRAFIIGQGDTRVVFVSIDAGMVSQAVTFGVIAELQKKYGKDLYTEKNVLMSGTHTHSGPGGYFQYFLYGVTSFGFVNESYDALVQGIVQSIDLAHNNLQQGRIYYAESDLLDASINRSPLSYQNNPPKERAKYEYDTDKRMLLLKFVDMKNNAIGMINWFSVHGTSMNYSNHLISSDNKGYASLLFEEMMNPNGTLPGKGPFVAAFAQSNEGDVSPNTDGAKCVGTNLPCDYKTSTCNERSQTCIASGPGKDMFESTKIIATKQFDMAKKLFLTASNILHGPVNFIHQYVNMSRRTFTIQNKTLTTCDAALGHSFGAGTTDGPGVFDFKQGTTRGNQNPFWDVVRDFIQVPSQEMIDCQSPKPILLPTGQMSVPIPWTPAILPTQLLTVGNLVIIGVPGEFTTMAGRRTRNAVRQIFETKGTNSTNLLITIAGLANVYGHYITTFEEYQVQRYEGASTLFGPNTLEAYMSQFQFLATNLGKTIDPGPAPPYLLDRQLHLISDPIFDVSLLNNFGSTTKNANEVYLVGGLVNVSFVCGNPRNKLMLNSTFLTVEYKLSNELWKTVATDANWETKFEWQSSLLHSTCTIEWAIPLTAELGYYRIGHQGYSKNLFGTVSPYHGYTNVFKITKQ